MIRAGVRSSPEATAFADALTGRLHALASAHALVSRTFGDAKPRIGDIGSLVRAIVAPHNHADAEHRRLQLHGPRVVLGDHAINGLALVFHELATNAAKYGAFSNEHGIVAVTWRTEGQGIELEWLEQGGPTIRAIPAQIGFGSTLVYNTVNRQLGGSLHHAWEPDGLRVTMTAPLARLKA